MGSADNGTQTLSERVRLASILMVQEGLEAEPADFFGRPHYQRGQRNAYRRGYKLGHPDTAEGRLEMDLPQVRDARQPFRSNLYELLKGDSQMLEQLATEMYVRGLSTRDIEAAFTDEHGVCLLSRTGVSEVTEALWEEYEGFQQRDLRDLPVSRGLPVPLTLTRDGAPGLLRAIDAVWPKSWRLRCWVHRIFNFKSKVPDHLWPEVKAHLTAIRDAPTREAGKANARDVLHRFGKDCPSLCAALSDDLEALLNHLRGPGATENTYAPLT